jgi:hypothetical protein
MKEVEKFKYMRDNINEEMRERLINKEGECEEVYK